MNEKPSLLKHAATYGAITGLALIAFSVILYVANQTANTTLGWLSYVILIVGITMGTVAYRDKVSGGFISYGGAFKTGLLITIFAGILTSVFSFFLMKYIDPEIVEQVILKSEEKLMEKGMNDDMIAMASERTRKFMTSPVSILMGLVGFTIVGAIISLITSAILKKEGAVFADDTQGE